MNIRHVLIAGLAGASMLAVPSCTSAGYIGVQYDAVYVDVAPPAPRVDIAIPPAPGPAYVWVPGHWFWTGVGYVWVHGRWRRAPAPHHVWVAAGWIFHNSRYRYIPGRWAHRDRRPRYDYVHPRPRRRTPKAPVQPRPRPRRR